MPPYPGSMYPPPPGMYPHHMYPPYGHHGPPPGYPGSHAPPLSVHPSQGTQQAPSTAPSAPPSAPPSATGPITGSFMSNGTKAGVANAGGDDASSDVRPCPPPSPVAVSTAAGIALLYQGQTRMQCSLPRPAPRGHCMSRNSPVLRYNQEGACLSIASPRAALPDTPNALSPHVGSDGGSGVQESEEELTERLRELRGLEAQRKNQRKMTKAEVEEQKLFKKHQGAHLWPNALFCSSACGLGPSG